MKLLSRLVRTASFAAGAALSCGLAFAQAPAAPAHTLLGTDCDAPPIYHCPDSSCEGIMVNQAGPVVEMKTRRPYFLDCPKGYRPGDKVNVVLSLHGAGSYANWQRNYAPFFDVKDKYHLVIITPSTPTRLWSEEDDDYLHNLVDSVVGSVGKANVERFILAGHSWGGLTSTRIICTDYFKDKVDVRISLSGGRNGDATRANRGFGQGGDPVYKQVPGKPATPPAPIAGPGGRPPGAPPGAGAANVANPSAPTCDFSTIFENGEYESTPAEKSPIADRFGCGARKQEDDVVDPKAGYVWDATRQDPGTDGWGHYPRSGRANVYVFPGCKGGRVVADVVRLQKGHTEGLEPNVTDKLIQLATSAAGGKIAKGSWTPPPPPPTPAGFGAPAAAPRPAVPARN